MTQRITDDGFGAPRFLPAVAPPGSTPSAVSARRGADALKTRDANVGDRFNRDTVDIAGDDASPGSPSTALGAANRRSFAAPQEEIIDGQRRDNGFRGRFSPRENVDQAIGSAVYARNSVSVFQPFPLGGEIDLDA